jgi:hypothetical protein
LLDSPASADEIYLARAGDVDPYRPVCQGDVFADVEIPGRDGLTLAMVLSHPCAMRAGPRLRARITVAPIREHQAVPLTVWSNGHLRIMPLPTLRQDDGQYAANLEEPATINAASLALENRVASLSDKGIVLLQQRYIHNHSRASIPLNLLYEVSAAVLEELELQESWNLALVKPAVEDGADLHESLEQQAEAFDQLLLTTDGDERTLRDLLHTPSERAQVRRMVNQTIDERRN